MDEPDKTLYLVDGTGICYRAYYAFNLTTSLGVPTGAVYGFYKTLLKLYKMFNPRYVSICFDVARQNIRHEQYAEYKAHRPPTPDDLVSQINAIRKMTEYLGLNISEQEGYEADDVIATLTRYGVSKGMKIVIVTSDKDMFQLLEDDKVTVYDPGKDKMINTNTFLKDFGFASTYMIDYLSLVGDASDNVPGAEGIGKVTGTKLISEYHDIENIYKNIDSIKGKLKDKLISSK
ncbi:MAG: 5'-3' exonuclease H3TH domain-containing protein, partial [Candidatus Omnitrophica bacterium]|nr:5'-3' exonuclease H3TH domain-containing protein [Candidatus Omnitrophota bacterium]